MEIDIYETLNYLASIVEPLLPVCIVFLGVNLGLYVVRKVVLVYMDEQFERDREVDYIEVCRENKRRAPKRLTRRKRFMMFHRGL